MKNLLHVLVLGVALFSASVNAADIDSTKLNKWNPTAAVGLNISQLALSNWTQGGENSIAYIFNSTAGMDYFSSNWNFRNNLKLAYGRTKLGGDDYRTNDNELYLESVVSKNIGWAIDPFFSNNLRTAVAPGYNYKLTPAPKIADFFDPAYLTQSLGFTYDKLYSLKTRIGVAVQEIITNKMVVYADDPNTAKIEKIKVDTGIESVTEGEYTLMQNLSYKTNLRLFSTFKTLDIWDIRWDNAFIAKVNDYINVNISALVVYEKKQSPKTQLKEGFMLGILYTIM